MSRSKDIGTLAETAVVKYLREHGWPYAERRALAGAQDLGDITGTPGLCWEIKSGKTAEKASDGLIADWLDETETERRHAGADIGILVTKRSGFGPDRAASWWAHMDANAFAALLVSQVRFGDDLCGPPVRMHLSTMVGILRAAGYGTPVGEVAA